MVISFVNSVFIIILLLIIIGLSSCLVSTLCILLQIICNTIAHFRVAACLSFKVSPAVHITVIEMHILMQIRLISLTVVEHQASL